MASYPLSYQGIEQGIIEISTYLKNQDIDRKEILETRLNLEETLMKYNEVFTESNSYELSMFKRFGQIRVLLKIKGGSAQKILTITLNKYAKNY